MGILNFASIPSDLPAATRRLLLNLSIIIFSVGGGFLALLSKPACGFSLAVGVLVGVVCFNSLVSSSVARWRKGMRLFSFGISFTHPGHPGMWGAN